MPHAPIRAPAIDPARLAAAAVRAPFALLWGPARMIRRTAESFFWGDPPPRGPCRAPLHVYKISCEPPCYGGCHCPCGCHRG